MATALPKAATNWQVGYVEKSGDVSLLSEKYFLATLLSADPAKLQERCPHPNDTLACTIINLTRGARSAYLHQLDLPAHDLEAAREILRKKYRGITFGN